MASVRYIVLAACQNAGLYAQAGWESEAAAWIEKQGSRPCAYVGYRRGQGVAGFDNVSVMFGGSDPRAALRRVRDSLERFLEFRSERQTEVDGFPALVMTARSKRRVYGVFGGGVGPTPPTPQTDDPMYFEAVEANSTVALLSMLETAPNLEYSTDGATWQEWQHTTAYGTHTFDTITLEAVGDRVYLRGVNPDGLAESRQVFSNFALTGAVNGGGNIMSLLDANMEQTEIHPFDFFGLFANFGGHDSALSSPPYMDTITSIGEYGCDSMFFGHTTLTAAADMPQLTTIEESGCYEMYYGCTSLTAAAKTPVLVTVGENGCAEMYWGDSALTTAADMPVLTTIGDSGCDSMYAECTSLTSAADMPALVAIGQNGCNNMYSLCSFAMSEDGTTLNFDFPTPPVTAGYDTYATAYDAAQWMGNTNGF